MDGARKEEGGKIEDSEERFDLVEFQLINNNSNKDVRDGHQFFVMGTAE